MPQAGSNVVATGSGSINIGGLSFLTNTGDGAAIHSGYSGSNSFASSGSGDAFNLDPAGGYIGVPTGYVSANALTDSATWDSTTLSDLGRTQGTYTYTWGSGANADSLTLNVGTPAPEPGSILLLGIGGTGLLLYGSRVKLKK